MSRSFVATSIARRLIARLQATHERRRISVFSGPPGIGKTTAIDEFARRRPGEVVVVKVARRNAREVLVLQHTLEAMRRLTGSHFEHVSSSLWELRNDVFGAICGWAGAEPAPARRGEYELADFPRLTIIFDEAQNLSRNAIEVLRYWNDGDRCYAPFPLGMAFVGNNEFSLGGANGSESVISAAVADRALYLQTLEYEDVTDDDLALFIDANAELDDGAMAAVMRSFRTPRALRSFRRVDDLLSDLNDLTGGRTVTAETVRQAFELA